MLPSVGFVSLGCAKNLVDSQIMAGALKRAGFPLAPAPERAEAILVNTCSFIRDAREESVEAIARACEQKRLGRCRLVAVAGCLPQRYRAQLERLFPLVDVFVGLDELDELPARLRAAAEGRACRKMFVSRARPTRLFTPDYPTLLFTGGPWAYLKISEGCDHKCAFCAIPGIRGAFRSRPMRDLVAEARALVRAGVREINLIAQDVLRYGVDLDARHRPQLVALLKKLDALEGDFGLRLLYGYPSMVTDELLAYWPQSRHLLPYIDIPVQHASARLLRSMGRADALEATQSLVAKLRSAVPNMAIRTTCLVGFPGETEDDFGELLAFVKEMRFDHLGAFAFSPEEGTRAAKMKNVPPEDVAEARRAKLMRVQRQIVRRRAERELTGRKDRLLLLKAEGRNGVGRLSRQAPEVDGLTSVRRLPKGARPGDFVDIRIEGFDGYDLLARC